VLRLCKTSEGVPFDVLDVNTVTVASMTTLLCAWRHSVIRVILQFMKEQGLLESLSSLQVTDVPSAEHPCMHARPVIDCALRHDCGCRRSAV
jgi:LisH-like dimerisation domain